MNEAVEYAVSSAVWSVGGLLVGYVLGRLERDVEDIKRIINGRKNR